VAPQAVEGSPRKDDSDAGRSQPVTPAAPQRLQDAAGPSKSTLPGTGRDASMPSTQEFLSAVDAGDIAAVQRLLDGGQPIDARDQDGRTALTHAVLRSDAKMVSLLIARGASPRTADKSARTPLDYAAEANSSAVLDALGRR
jgi:hypothetical protein